MKKNIDKYNGNYTYKKHQISTGKSSKGFPIVERTTNATLYPEAIKDSIDLKEMKEK